MVKGRAPPTPKKVKTRDNILRGRTASALKTSKNATTNAMGWNSHAEKSMSAATLFRAGVKINKVRQWAV